MTKRNFTQKSMWAEKLSTAHANTVYLYQHSSQIRKNALIITGTIFFTYIYSLSIVLNYVSHFNHCQKKKAFYIYNNDKIR